MAMKIVIEDRDEGNEDLETLVAEAKAAVERHAQDSPVAKLREEAERNAEDLRRRREAMYEQAARLSPQAQVERLLKASPLKASRAPALCATPRPSVVVNVNVNVNTGG